jgi:hypothetical protein
MSRPPVNRRDTFSLDRNQRADVFCAGGTLRLIADHPLNAPLIGVCSKAAFVRATELSVEQGDKTVVVYAARAGKELRAASAIVQCRPGGATVLTDWRVEAGFTHRCDQADGGHVHRIVAAPATVGVASVGTAPAAATGSPGPATAEKSAAGKPRRDRASGRS